jgi:hypothetical protein
MISRAPLSVADLSEIWSAAQRRRSEHSCSLVFGWLSRRARVDSDPSSSTQSSSTPKTLGGVNLYLQHVEHPRLT